LAGGLGPTAVSRYQRDVLNQPGIRWAVIFEGVNDIGGMRDNSQAGAEKLANRLIEAYKQMISEAHEKNILIYGGTIMPFKNNGYYTVYRDVCRNLVNDWIRTSHAFDAVIDFDHTMRNPSDTTTLQVDYLFENDYLHPNAAGHARMGESVDLNLFKRGSI
jgi:lysophospholipase L1-like esterase